jgi:hypothetical protein
MFKRIVVAFALSAILWIPLTGFAAESRDNWGKLTPREKERVRQNYERWQSLPPQDKEHLREEWNRYRTLPPDRREQLKRRYEDLRKKG